MCVVWLEHCFGCAMVCFVWLLCSFPSRLTKKLFMILTNIANLNLPMDGDARWGLGRLPPRGLAGWPPATNPCEIIFTYKGIKQMGRGWGIPTNSDQTSEYFGETIPHNNTHNHPAVVTIVLEGRLCLTVHNKYNSG